MAYLHICPTVSVAIERKRQISVEMEDVTVNHNRIPTYTGTYEVTPTQERQVLPTAGKRLDNDIVVESIPENYGLITWNGSFIRVS